MEIPDEQPMYSAQSAAVEKMISDWEDNRHEAVYLQTTSNFFYNTLYEGLNGVILYLQDSDDTVTDLVIRLAVSRMDIGNLGGGPDENLIYELHQRDGLQYISIRSSGQTPGPLREYMCRRSSMSVSYLPDFKDTEFEESLDQLFAGLVDAEPDMEFIKADGQYYRMNRETGSCLPLTDDSDELLFVWLQDISEQAVLAAKKAKITLEVVQNALPDGYLLGIFEQGQYYDYVVADMNCDGYDDILAEIRPVNPAFTPDERSDTPPNSPYRKLDPYYALELWLLEGRADGGYTPRQLEDDIVWNDTYSFGMGEAFYGGFSKSYFIGRSPFSEYTFYYEYDKGADCFRMARSYYTYSYDNILTGRFMIENENNFGQITLPGAAPDREAFFISYLQKLENEMMDAYPFSYATIYQLPVFADQEQAEAVDALIRDDLDQMVAALDGLGQMESPYLHVESAFSNPNILVVSYEISDNIAIPSFKDEVYYERKLYRMYDLKTNERIPAKEAVTFPELTRLALLEGAPIDNLLEQYIHLEDPAYELDIRNNPMSLFLTQEGLCMLTCESPETRYPVYQRTLRLIPREYVLNMEISGRWDDVPEYPVR